MSIPPTPGEYTSPSPLGDPSVAAPEDRTMGMIAYVLAIFTSWLGPLILWLVKKDQSKFVAYHSLQALLLTAGYFAVIVASNILSAVHLWFIGVPIVLIAGLGFLVLNIIAAIAANKGEYYDMPIVGKYARQFAGL